MWFTRAAMSSARCIKLLNMMGLQRLDDPNTAVEMAPTLAPPRDWTEQEGMHCFNADSGHQGNKTKDFNAALAQKEDESSGAHFASTHTPPYQLVGPR